MNNGAHHMPNLTGPQAGKRLCLRCGVTFLSEGPWNRVCPHCSEANERPDVDNYVPPVHRAHVRQAFLPSHCAEE